MYRKGSHVQTSRDQETDLANQEYQENTDCTYKAKFFLLFSVPLSKEGKGITILVLLSSRNEYIAYLISQSKVFLGNVCAPLKKTLYMKGQLHDQKFF